MQATQRAEDRPPRVFVSFTHETDEHDARVEALENSLRERGVDSEAVVQEALAAAARSAQDGRMPTA